jgi:hypothetical protein
MVYAPHANPGIRTMRHPATHSKIEAYSHLAAKKALRGCYSRRNATVSTT